jgi:hypothetical protein
MNTATGLSDTEVLKRNEVIIEAYGRIIQDIIALLPDYSTEQLRTYMVKGASAGEPSWHHSFYSVILYVSIGLINDDCVISFAKNQEIRWYVSLFQETACIRAIYRHTAAEQTGINIEGCLEEYCYVYDSLKEATQQCEIGNPEYHRVTVAPTQKEA